MIESRAALAAAIIALVTAAIRFAPFIFLRGRETPKFILDLGRYLPFSVMTMLVVYCLKSVNFESAGGFLPELIASAVVIVSYVFKKNTLLSIIAGTAVYMLMVQFVFV